MPCRSHLPLVFILVTITSLCWTQHAIAQVAYEPIHEESRFVGEEARSIGDKIFCLSSEGYWVDSEFNHSHYRLFQVEYMSVEWLNLIDRDQDLAMYLGLDEKMVVVWDGYAYQVSPSDDAGPIGITETPPSDDDIHPRVDKKPPSKEVGETNYLGVLLIVVLAGIVTLAFIKGRQPE